MSIDCDSYHNEDPSQGNADGFSPKLDVGTGNYFSGCRSWQNSDKYQLTERSSVTLKVYDIFGREIATLVEESKPLGSHLIQFNSDGLSSGIYFACLNTGSSSKTIKLTLIK